MGTSFIEFKDKGFWTHDAFLEGLSFLLAREFEKIEDKQAWQRELITNWRDAASAGFVGCVPSYFQYFDTHDKVELLREALIRILNKLQNDANFLTVSQLNENNVGQGRWIELNLHWFINITKLTLKLIDGELKTDAASPIDYWNVD